MFFNKAPKKTKTDHVIYASFGSLVWDVSYFHVNFNYTNRKAFSSSSSWSSSWSAEAGSSKDKNVQYTPRMLWWYIIIEKGATSKDIFRWLLSDQYAKENMRVTYLTAKMSDTLSMVSQSPMGDVDASVTPFILWETRRVSPVIGRTLMNSCFIFWGFLFFSSHIKSLETGEKKKNSQQQHQQRGDIKTLVFSLRLDALHSNVFLRLGSFWCVSTSILFWVCPAAAAHPPGALLTVHVHKCLLFISQLTQHRLVWEDRPPPVFFPDIGPKEFFFFFRTKRGQVTWWLVTPPSPYSFLFLFFFLADVYFDKISNKRIVHDLIAMATACQAAFKK